MLAFYTRNFIALRCYKYGNLRSIQCLIKSYCDDKTPKTFIPSYKPKPCETDGEKRARLLYQSRKRGMLENDLLFSTFVDKYLIDMDKDLLAQYDALINSSYSDWDIYYWVIGAKAVPPEFDNEIMHLLKEHVQNKKKEHRLRQPDLPNFVFNK